MTKNSQMGFIHNRLDGQAFVAVFSSFNRMRLRVATSQRGQTAVLNPTILCVCRHSFEFS